MSTRKELIVSRFKTLLIREMVKQKFKQFVQENRTSESKDECKRNNDCTYIASNKICILKFLELSGLKKDDILVDLGCGDGRLLITAATYAKCKCIGIEKQKDLIEKATKMAHDANVSKLVEIIECDFKSIQCKHILKQATVVYVYLLPPIMPFITETLQNTVKCGCRVISYIHDLGRNKDNNKAITINTWPYPSFGCTEFIWKNDMIFVTNLHPDFEYLYNIKIAQLEYCRLTRVNNRDYSNIISEYDFILFKRYLFGVMSNYYQNNDAMTIVFQYKYKETTDFEAVEPKQIIEVRNRLKNGSDVITDLKLYDFPLKETHYGWKHENAKYRWTLPSAS